MTEFEDACEEVLAKLHEHQLAGTPEALHGLIRAQLRRSNALTDMVQYLDTLDDTGRRR